MLKRRRAKRAAVLTCLLLGAIPLALSADWPQFRGARGDGRSTETGLLDHWPDAGPAVLWRVPLGEGFSAVSVAGDRLFTMFASGAEEFVGCLDAKTGAQRWRTAVGAKWTDRFGNGPRSTPTVAGDRVFALGSKGNLVALNTQDGGVIWQRDLKADFGARAPDWGISTSPLLLGERLLVDVGGRKGSALVAFDAASGKVLWQSGSGEAGYAAPLPLTVAGVEQVVFFRASGLVAVSPADGAELWRHPWETSYDVNAAMPVFVPPDRIFVSSGYDVGAALLRIAADKADKAGEAGRAGKGKSGRVAAEQVWRTREMKNQFSSSVYHEGHLYGFDDKTLKCIDAGTGETRWRKRELGHGSLILADGMLIALGDAGRLVLIEAGPEAYVERGQFQAFSGKTWTMPSLAGGTLFLRDERELQALAVGGNATVGGSATVDDNKSE